MNRKKGFTLIELIAVVAIIAILAAVILPNVFGQIRKSRTSRNLSEVEDIRKGALMYFADVGLWPVEVGNTDGAIDRLLSNSAPLITKAVSNWRGPYLDKAPRTGTPGRYSTQYDGCLMLNDTDNGAGDGALTDRNGNGVGNDRWVYLGDVPSIEANDLDQVVDGGDGPTAGAVLGGVAGENCGGNDTNTSNGNWPTNAADAPVTVIFIINEGS